MSGLLLLSVVWPVIASAQQGPVRPPARPAPPALKSVPGKWEIELHGGGALGSQPSGGTRIFTFPVGTTFTTPSGFSSRFASSWLFGDGATLINQIGTSFTGSTAATTRMTSLDPVLTKAALKLNSSYGLGARVTRRLTSRLDAEFSFDTTGGSRRLADGAQADIEATRASFVPMWNALIATGGGIFATPTVTAQKSVTASTSGRQTIVTAAATVALAHTARVTPFVTGGGGVLHRSDALPSATITGNYQFMFLGTAPFNQSDVVTIHFTQNNTSFVGILGAGLKYALNATQGIRAELRANITSNTVNTLVDAHPVWITGTPAFSISSNTTTSLVFSNTASVPTNLTAPNIDNLKTFTGQGRDVHVTATVGYYFRF